MRAALALALLSCLAPAWAEVRWLCSLSGDLVRLHCDAATAGAAPVPAAAPGTEAPSRPAHAAPAVQVNGTRFPLDPQRRWTVELWSPPIDAEFVRLLARSTICYRTPDCSVQVDLGMLERKGR